MTLSGETSLSQYRSFYGRHITRIQKLVSQKVQKPEKKVFFFSPVEKTCLGTSNSSKNRNIGIFFRVESISDVKKLFWRSQVVEKWILLQGVAHFGVNFRVSKNSKFSKNWIKLRSDNFFYKYQNYLKSISNCLFDVVDMI